jgi:hypothetical protein
MEKTIIVVLGSLILCASAAAQEQPRILRGDGHLLGETAEQFFSEALAGELWRACERKDWKTLKQLANDGSKTRVKDVCASEKLAKQQATIGARLEYSGPGDTETMRADTFTLDGGHLVKIHMLYTAQLPMSRVIIRNRLTNCLADCRKPTDSHRKIIASLCLMSME